jgi:hypothetical protein
MDFDRTLLLSILGCVLMRGWGGAPGSLHVVLRSSGTGFGVPLVERDAFGFAHKGELDIDAVEEFGREEGGVGRAGCDGGELGPVPGDEFGIVDAKAGIEEWAGVDEIEEALLLGAHCPQIFFQPLEEAEGVVFVVEFVGYCGDGGSAEKLYGLLEAGFERCFNVIGEGDAFVTGGYFREGAEAFA